MIRDAILAMEPGRELDKLVAQDVMGYTIYHYDKDYRDNCYYMLMNKEFDPVLFTGNWRDSERKTEEEAWNDCPKFSENIGAAWEVRQWLLDYVGGVKLERLCDILPEYCEVYCGKEKSLIQVQAETMAEAISKASLLVRLEEG